jgi:hypothetical protein
MSPTQDVVNRRSSYRTPSWVKIMGIIVLVLILLIGATHLAGSGHGPGSHLPSASVTEATSSSIEHGMHQP